MSSEDQTATLPNSGSTEKAEEYFEGDIQKHPLQTSWTLFYKDPDVSTKDWSAAVKEVLSFNTVEDFWALFNNITTFSQLKDGSDYSLFRGGIDERKIKPAWEDPANKEGGVWKFAISRNAGVKSEIIDEKIVQELFMSCVGEMFGHASDVVNGVVASKRRQEYRFEIWTSTCDNDLIKMTGETLKEILPPRNKIILEFISNADAEHASQRSRGVKPRPSLQVIV